MPVTVHFNGSDQAASPNQLSWLASMRIRRESIAGRVLDSLGRWALRSDRPKRPTAEPVFETGLRRRPVPWSWGIALDNRLPVGSVAAETGQKGLWSGSARVAVHRSRRCKRRGPEASDSRNMSVIQMSNVEKTPFFQGLQGVNGYLG